MTVVALVLLVLAAAGFLVRMILGPNLSDRSSLSTASSSPSSGRSSWTPSVVTAVSPWTSSSWCLSSGSSDRGGGTVRREAGN